MRNDCDIVRDLLPLYSEDLLSDSSRLFIEEHLSSCRSCESYLDNIQEKDPVLEESPQILNKLHHVIKRDKAKSVFIAAVFVTTLAVLLFFHLTAPQYIPYDSTDMKVVEIEGSDYVLLELANKATAYEINQTEDHIYTITTWTSSLDQLMGKQTLSTIVINKDKEEVDCVLYSEFDGLKSVEIYGEQNLFKGEVILPRLVLSMYMTLAFLLSIALVIIVLLTRKWKKINLVMSRLLAFTSLYVICSWLLTLGDFSTYAPLRELSQILILTFIGWMTYIQLHNWHKNKPTIKK